MNAVLNNLKIYCAYHDKQMFDDYNLYESNIIKPYYLLDENIFDDWLIKNNSILNEFQLMLYIYDHNIKSKYVGFCHYKRFWNYVDIEQLEKTGLIFWMAYNANNKNDSVCFIGNIYGHQNYGEDFKKYLYYFDIFIKNNYPELLSKYNKIISGEIQTYNMWCEMFVVKWEIFVKIIGFIKHYLFYTFGNNLENIDKYDPNIYDSRKLALFIEIIICILFNLFYDSNVWESNMHLKHMLYSILVYTGKENLDDWIKKQYSIGITDIIIFNNSNKEIDLSTYFKCTNINKSYYDFNNDNDMFLYLSKKYNIMIPEYYIVFKNNEYLSKDEIIQYKNELWNNKEISNKKILKFNYD